MTLTRMADQSTIDAELAEWIQREGLFIPVPTTDHLDRDVDLEIQRRADLAVLLRDRVELRAYAYQESGRNFWFWRNNFCWLFDDVERMCPIPHMGWEYIGDIQASYLGLEGWRTSLGELPFSAWAKSRRIGFTVAVCAAASWGFAVANDRSGNQIFMSLQAKRVCDNTRSWSSSIFGKIRNILDWQPAWLQPPSWRNDRRFSDRNLLLSCDERQSYITGLGANFESLRSMRGWRVFFDEANFIDLDRALKAGDKVGPIFCGSSVTSKHTGFGKLCHGVDIPLCEPGGDGVIVRRAHYSQHPNYNPATEHGMKRIEAEKKRMTPEAWASEMEIDWQTAQVGLIWAAYFDPELHCVKPGDDYRHHASRARDHGRLYEGWDFGRFSLTSWTPARYVEADDVLYIMDNRAWFDGLVSCDICEQAQPTERCDCVARTIGDLGYRTKRNPSGELPYERVGDIAGKQSSAKRFGGRRHKPLHGWMRNLYDEGIDVWGQSLDVETAIDIVRRKLSEGRILLMPAACRRHNRKVPSVQECIENYKRKLPKGVTPEEYQGDTPPPEKDIFSHTADGIQHIAWAIWG